MMSPDLYDIACVQTPGYLHAIVTGENTREAVSGYMKDLVRECHARGVRRLLIEKRLVGPRLPLFTVFTIAAELSGPARRQFNAIAYVDAYADSSDMLHFAETVAVNRGVPLRVFQSVEAARGWLDGLAGDPSPGSESVP